MIFSYAATFGWLCVETMRSGDVVILAGAATFGWLCVETTISNIYSIVNLSSHLRVAVC